MRQGQRYGHEGLRVEAESAVRRSGKKRKDVAAELGIAPSSVTNALKVSGPKYASLQKGIIEHLTDYRMTESTIFEAVRKEK